MIEIRDLSFSYNKKGNKKTLDKVSFTLEEGKIGILLGKNGSGKTTLFKNILGIEKPSEGTILIDKTDVLSLKRMERASLIGYVPQDIMYGDLNVYDTIMAGRISSFGFIHSYKDELIVNQIIKEMGLEDFSSRNVWELSGGEKQKVAIARALVQEPKVLIFDEPTGNLDIANEQLILKEARKLASEKGITILISIHDLNLAMEFGEYFFFIKDGKILARCSKEELDADILKETFDTEIEIENIKGRKIILLGELYEEN